MWLFYTLPIVAVFLMGVIHASETLDRIRMNWNEYRCNPIYIPFAGVIRPDVGVEMNFQYCINQFGQSIFKFLIDALMSMFKDVGSSLTEMGTTLPAVRSVFTRMRKVMLSFASQTFGKISNSMGSITYLIIKIRDLMKRFVGEGYIGAFISLTAMDFIRAFVTLVIGLIKTFVSVTLAASVILSVSQPELLVLATLFASLIAAAGF